MLAKIGIWGSLQSCWDHEMRFPLFLPVERRNDDVTGVLPPPNKLNCAVGRARFPGSSGPVILLLARSLSAVLFSRVAAQKARWIRLQNRFARKKVQRDQHASEPSSCSIDLATCYTSRCVCSSQ